jgi:hypothetical protein
MTIFFLDIRGSVDRQVADAGNAWQGRAQLHACARSRIRALVPSECVAQQHARTRVRGAGAGFVRPRSSFISFGFNAVSLFIKLSLN